MTTYSPELILETIKCFREENGVVIDENTASECLDSLANLYLAFKPKEPNLNNDLEGSKLLSK